MAVRSAPVAAPQSKRTTDVTHVFAWGGDDVPRCYGCDARFGSTTATWPCGFRPPRVVNGVFTPAGGQR